MPTTSTTQSKSSWLESPSNLLSLGAAILSAITFFLVYIDKGEIVILLPQDLGIGISNNSKKYDLLVSAAFSNTGAPRTRFHIQSISADVRSSDSPLFTGKYFWTFEQRFLGSDEYLQKYKDKKDEGFRDYLDYVSRAIPFTLKGGDSSAKTIELEKMGDIDLTVPLPKEIQIELALHTDSGIFKATEIYICPHAKPEVGNATYCVKK